MSIERSKVVPKNGKSECVPFSQLYQLRLNQSKLNHLKSRRLLLNLLHFKPVFL